MTDFGRTAFHHEPCDARWTLEGKHSMAVCPNCSILVAPLTRHPATEKLWAWIESVTATARELDAALFALDADAARDADAEVERLHGSS